MHTINHRKKKPIIALQYAISPTDNLKIKNKPERGKDT
jgi:hypothetical protein